MIHATRLFTQRWLTHTALSICSRTRLRRFGSGGIRLYRRVKLGAAVTLHVGAYLPLNLAKLDIRLALDFHQLRGEGVLPILPV